MDKDKLKIVVFTEGKAGHLSQSRGIAELVESDKDVREIKVNLDLSPEESLLRGLTGFHCLIKIPPASNLWNRAAKYLNPEDIEYLAQNKPDYVISAGTVPASFNIIAKKHFRCNNIVAMRPSLLPLSAFDLVILPEHDIKGDEKDNVISINTSPNSCLPENIIEEGHDFAYHNGINRNYDLWSLFIGGPSKVRDFLPDKVLSVIKSILDLSVKYDAKLLISTSRRTPDDFEDKLRGLSEVYNHQIQYLQIYRTNPVSTMRPLLSLSSRVFITEDSVSMVSESLWAERSTSVIELPSKIPAGNDKINRFKNNLLEKGLISNINTSVDLEAFIERSSDETGKRDFKDVEKVRNALNALINGNV